MDSYRDTVSGRLAARTLDARDRETKRKRKNLKITNEIMDAGVPSDSVIRGNKDLNYRAFLNSDPSHSSQQHRPLHLPRQRPIEGGLSFIQAV